MKCCNGTTVTRKTPVGSRKLGRVKVETFYSHAYNCTTYMVQWDVPYELPTDRIKLGRNG